MQKFSVMLVVAAVAFFFTSFDQGQAVAGQGEKAGGKGAGATFKMIDFVTTQDSSPLVIKPELFNTPQAIKFAKTGKNPYIGKPKAIEAGKNLFQLYSCTECHGGNAQGWTGPSLWSADLRIYKDSTNKGMFETIWHGTNGGMGAKGMGLMEPGNPNVGLTPDEVLKIIAWIRTHGNITGN